ncbi:MAG: class I adenylate-forming enzyme family protein [Pseudomonadota bacterium]
MSRTLFAALRDNAAARPDAPAILTEAGAISHRALLEEVERVATGFAAHGIGAGDVVAVQLPNIPEFIVTMLAAGARGAITQTVHMPYRRDELKTLLGHSGAKAAIALANGKDHSPAGEIEALAPDLPALEHVFAVGGSFDDLRANADPSALTPAGPDDAYLLLYTSGTTASPKGVPHPARGFMQNAADAAAAFGIDGDGRILSFAPFTHLYGLMTVHMAVLTGAAAALLPAFAPPAVPGALKTFRPTVVYAAPAHFAPLVGSGALSSALFEETRVVSLSGAAVPKRLAASVDALLPNGSVIQLWGMSELQAGAYGRPDDPAEQRLTTTGRPAPGTEARVTEAGALEVRGPSVFAGYRNNPDETAAAFSHDGWFQTGDTAVIDADGFIRLTGRTKEIINRGGIKFNPADIEEILLDLPAIAQCAIIPLPDPVLGERACLCAELHPGAALRLEDVTARLDKEGVAKFKWPERLEVFDALPITPTRKVMRGALAAALRG